MIYWFFGYPGIGKDYCAKELSKIGKFPHIDADDFLTATDKKKLLNKTFTTKDRVKKLTRIVKHIKKLQKKSNSVAIADSLPDNKSRKFVLKSFKEVKLIHVIASEKVHRERISKRSNHFFTERLLNDYISKNWQEVKVDHVVFKNVETKDWSKRIKKLL